MMQEFARLFKADEKVGCSVLDRWFCFSTVKNNTSDARLKLAAGSSGESAMTAEFEMLPFLSKMLRISS